ncbi:2715_t:CDS:2 [Ambispora gerdemannii]|uniref:2715_t:CDS:1 n=1 Tax=Ambispora gerdemannii TaxID=144530 RepID=A0A9N8ZV01_9GLOM|nr:2715_t:CDS:2 [Ambispora gerdemannii]
MGISRQSRITILLVIDTFFFLLEIIVGSSVNSLALVADSFHMLNDVISLIVALYAVKLAARTTFSSKYSYGWQRAEVLGALVNGVFLLALCFSIFIEAIQRFFDPKEIKNPMLVLIVGTAGFISNLIGLVLFHEHGHGHEHKEHSDIQSSETVEPSPNERRLSTPIDEILVHPAQSRQFVVQAAQAIEEDVSEVESDGQDITNAEQAAGSTPAGDLDTNENLGATSPSNAHRSSYGTLKNTHGHKGQPHDTSKHSHGHKHEHHKGHAHGGQNLNMQGVFLHVLGDALGNIGVIATALFINYTEYKWRFYADPIISLVITVIIFSSALPLVRSASYILLQGVPSGIPIDVVREKLRETPGVLSVHELHIWQLSDTKLIASVHVLLDPRTDYMTIAADIRKILHSYGVHSATIQPEFIKSSNASTLNDPDAEMIANEIDGHESACLLRCAEDETCAQNVCCPTPATTE